MLSKTLCCSPIARRLAGNPRRRLSPSMKSAGSLSGAIPSASFSVRALAVIRILNDMAQQFQTAVIVVTHDEKIIPTFKRIYHIRDGVTHEEAGEGRSFA